MGLDITDISDIIVTCQQNLGKGKFTDLAPDRQNYPFAEQIMTEKKIKLSGGFNINRNVRTTTGDAAKHVTLMEEDQTNIPDLMDQLTVPWRHSSTSFGFSRRVMNMHKGGAELVDYYQSQRSAAELDLYTIIEDAGWDKPADKSDKTTPWGVLQYIVKNSTAGFTGGNPAGFDDCAGMDVDDVPAWKNYSYPYKVISKTDLLAGIRSGMRKTKWSSPIRNPEYAKTRPNQEMFTNDYVIGKMEELAEAQNDRLGFNLNPAFGEVAFKRVPVYYVSTLDDDASNPIYCIDWACFYPVCLNGEYFQEDPPAKSASQHTVLEVFIDLTWNVLCDNRRRQAVYYVA